MTYAYLEISFECTGEENDVSDNILAIIPTGRAIVWSSE